MADLAPYAPAELAVCDAVEDIVPCSVWTGEDLPERLPAGQVRRVGGPDNGHTDTARVVVSVFAASASQARILSEQVRQRLTSGPRRTPSGVIDRVSTESGPQIAPTADSDAVRRRDAIYRVRVRRRT